MSLMSEYLVAPAVAIAVAAAGYGVVQDRRADSLETEVRDAHAIISAMEARLVDIEEDRASDREIDDADVDELRRRAARWMREAAPAADP